MALSAIGIALSAAPYPTFSPDVGRIPRSPAAPWHIAGLSLHALPGGLALLLGSFQFVPALRGRYPELHRAIGRVSLACILVGSATAVYATAVSLSGPAAHLGLLLHAAWFYRGLMACLAIRWRQLPPHRDRMMRNHASYLIAGWFIVPRAPGASARWPARAPITVPTRDAPTRPFGGAAECPRMCPRLPPMGRWDGRAVAR